MTQTKDAKLGLFASETSEVFLSLVTIDHDDLGSPVRIVNDLQSIVSNGDTYEPFPFEIVLAASQAEELVTATLRICNVDRGIVTALRPLTSAPTVTIQIILASDPDSVQLGPQTFTWRVATYDARAVEGELQLEDILSEPYPGDRVTPSLFPGVF